MAATVAGQPGVAMQARFKSPIAPAQEALMEAYAVLDEFEIRIAKAKAVVRRTNARLNGAAA